LSLPDFEALPLKNYRVAFPAGTVALRGALEKYLDPDQHTEIWRTSQGLEMLQLKRVDIYLDLKHHFENFFQNNPEWPGKIFLIGTPLRVSGHIFLKPRHQGLAEQLNAALKAFKQESDYTDSIKKFDLRL